LGDGWQLPPRALAHLEPRGHADLARLSALADLRPAHPAHVPPCGAARGTLERQSRAAVGAVLQPRLAAALGADNLPSPSPRVPRTAAPAGERASAGAALPLAAANRALARPPRGRGRAWARRLAVYRRRS